MPLYARFPRLTTEHYRGRGLYFVTICCAERRAVFGDLVLGRETVALLVGIAAQHSFLLHSFCLMPDHLHFLAEGAVDTSDLVKFVNVFKQISAFRFRRTNSNALWQSRFYDHILRKAERIERVVSYIWMNPVRKGLCAEPRDYPLSGPQVAGWRSCAAIEMTWIPPWKNTQKKSQEEV